MDLKWIILSLVWGLWQRQWWSMVGKRFFKTQRGNRQCNPLSCYPFIMVTSSLIYNFRMENQTNIIRIPCLKECILSPPCLLLQMILLYFFISKSKSISTIQNILLDFERKTWMNVNGEKYVAIPFNTSMYCLRELLMRFICILVHQTMHYLGLHLFMGSLTDGLWILLDERLIKNLYGWKMMKIPFVELSVDIW